MAKALGISLFPCNFRSLIIKQTLNIKNFLQRISLILQNIKKGDFPSRNTYDIGRNILSANIQIYFIIKKNNKKIR